MASKMACFNMFLFSLPVILFTLQFLQSTATRGQFIQLYFEKLHSLLSLTFIKNILVFV